MIGIRKFSPGRMGNRLFHYHFLRQIARKTRVDYFHCKLPDLVYFEGMTKKPKPLIPFRKSIQLTSKDIVSFSPQEFLNFISTESNKKNIFFDPPILGEVFFDYLFYPPGEFVKIRTEYCVDFNFSSAGRTVIGIHFRGTDFPDWNKYAALKFPYYRESILLCLESFSEPPPLFILFTDDIKYPAFTETVSFLKSLQNVEYHFGDITSKPIHDFYQMTQCDVLISSPSTFAIFAGCLGKTKKIIHDKSWLNYAVGRNDTFWVKLAENRNIYYSLWKIF